LAGVIGEISFARFMASMAIFNAERVPSFPSDSWGSVSIVGTQRGGKNTVLREAVRKSTASREIGDRPVLISHVQIERSHAKGEYFTTWRTYVIYRLSGFLSDTHWRQPVERFAMMCFRLDFVSSPLLGYKPKTS